ncbi:MAG: hypothetical protein ACNS61_13520 [Candidatus Wenzhouxiangella sp. M2_3B_020]
MKKLLLSGLLACSVDALAEPARYEVEWQDCRHDCRVLLDGTAAGTVVTVLHKGSGAAYGLLPGPVDAALAELPPAPAETTGIVTRHHDASGPDRDGNPGHWFTSAFYSFANGELRGIRITQTHIRTFDH